MLSGQARWKEVMAQPLSRAEAQALEDRMLAHVMSCACGIEALENILVKQGLLKNNELMEAVGALLKQKSEQAAREQPKNILEV